MVLNTREWGNEMGTTLEWLLELLYNELGEINEEDYKRFTEELALLRRLADALCTIAGTTRGARGVVFCQVCNGSGLGIGIECVKHTATCDVAIHLDLPREKGDVE